MAAKPPDGMFWRCERGIGVRLGELRSRQRRREVGVQAGRYARCAKRQRTGLRRSVSIKPFIVAENLNRICGDSTLAAIFEFLASKRKMR